MINRSFEPGFRINLHQKDLNLALTTARQIGVSLPNTANAQELFNACAAQGGAGWDHSGMIRDLDRKSVVEGKRESVRVDIGGGRSIKKKRKKNKAKETMSI